MEVLSRVPVAGWMGLDCLEQGVLMCDSDRLGAIDHFKFTIDILEVEFDRALRDT